MSLGTDYIVKYLSDISGAVYGAKQLENVNSNLAKNIQAKYGQAIKSIGKLPSSIKEIPIKFNGKDAIKTITTTGEVVKTTSGAFLEMGKVQTSINGQLVNTATSVKNVTSQFVQTNLETAKANKIFTNLGNNIKQLAGRALFTIPIWIALRGAIMGTIAGVKNGVKDLIDFDLALQKIRNNLQGTPEQISASFGKIKRDVTEVSKATGIGTEEIAAAVKEFATLGFTAEESLAGATGATKLAVVLFGNASETANAFAKSLNILIDRSEGAKSSVDQMNEAFALTSQLQEVNNFNINEVTEALEKFSGTAAGVGFTMPQTLQVLAALGTAGRQGSSGATLLSTSLVTLVKNLPKVTSTLGLTVAAGESTFDTFRKVVTEVTKLNNTPGGKQTAINAMADIFGGARGTKIVQSLVSVNDRLEKNIQTTANYDALNAKLKRTLETESGQARILGNTLKENGKAFVSAIIGAEDFTDSLIKLNNVAKQVGDGLKPLGTIINSIFSNFGYIAGTAFVLRFVKVATVTALFSKLAAGSAAIAGIGARLSFIFAGGFIGGFKTIGALAVRGLAASFIGAGATGVIGTALAVLLSPVTLIAGVIGKIAGDALTNNFIKKVEANNNKMQSSFDKVMSGLSGNLAIPDLTILIEQMTLKQKPGDEGMINQIGALRKQLKKQIEATYSKKPIEVDAEVKPLISFSEEQELAKQVIERGVERVKQEGALNSEALKYKEQLHEILGIKEEAMDVITRQGEIERAINEENQAVNRILLNDSIERLKAEGASNAQILIATELKSKQLNLEENSITKLDRQLQIERAKSEEKRLQNKLSSDSMKLYDIAKSEGVDVAKRISDVLAGKLDFDSFVKRGGKSLEIFKEQFGDVFKQQQAQQFFQGDRVSGESTSFRGGTRISIQEKALGKNISQFDPTLSVAQSTAQRTITNVQPSIPVTINAEIDVSKLNEVKEMFIKEVSKRLSQAGTEVNKSLTTALTGNQGTKL